MAMTNTAEKQDAFIDVDTLNRMPMADEFQATEPARMVAENVCCGPVLNYRREAYWLVRIEGRIASIGKTEVEALEASEGMVLRYLWRLEGNRARAKAAAERQAEVAASIAACPRHTFREVEISRCLRRIVCSCGYVETVSSDG